MLSGEGNAEERWKTIIYQISKKSNFARAAHLFCTFLCRCFCTWQRETSRNFFNSCTFYGGNVVRVLVHFFFIAAHFHLALVAASFSYFVTAATKCSCCSSNKKKCFLRFFSLAVDLCRPFSHWASLACSLTFSFSLSFSCSIFQICRHAGQWI